MTTTTTSTTELPITELERDYYGNDKRAINRHSTRTYQCGPYKFMLDRTLDFNPPFFQLTRFPEKTGLHRTVKVLGQEYWGSGYTWNQAIAVAFPVIRAKTQRLLELEWPTYDELEEAYLDGKNTMPVDRINHREFVQHGIRYFCCHDSKSNGAGGIFGWSVYKAQPEESGDR